MMNTIVVFAIKFVSDLQDAMDLAKKYSVSNVFQNQGLRKTYALCVALLLLMFKYSHSLIFNFNALTIQNNVKYQFILYNNSTIIIKNAFLFLKNKFTKKK